VSGGCVERGTWWRCSHWQTASAFSRDRLLEALWPEQEPATATHNLHQAMYVARRALRHSGVGDLLTMDGDQVVLYPGRVVEVDAVEFERLAAAALAADDAALLAAVDDLYAGDLLPELPYADWAADRRTGLREAHHAVLVRLAETKALNGCIEESQLVLDRVLVEDSVHEGAVRARMRLLARAGRRSAALERYEVLRDDLLKAYGTDPDDQSRRLFRDLLTTQESTAARRGRLPSPATSFVGRERELREVGELVRRGRLVTLTGPGGCGKTRLAVEAARAAAGRHAQGAWFVDLGALSDGDLVPDVVADALELTPAGPAPLRSLAQQLRSWRGLIVLDTCEHLILACAELADTLLAECPGVHLLAASREPLHASGEVSFRVPSLALPPGRAREGSAEEGRVERVAGFAAVQLFVDRAQQVGPSSPLPARTAEQSRACASPSTASRWRSSSPRPGWCCWSLERSSSGSTGSCRCLRRASLARTGTRPSAPHSTGAMTCSRWPSRSCCIACRALPAPSTCWLSRRCAAVRRWAAT
jgi:DNA-binding SARP family transcriptional activator